MFPLKLPDIRPYCMHVPGCAVITDSDDEVGKGALKTGASVYDLVLEKGWLTQEKLDDILRPENMTDPGKMPK